MNDRSKREILRLFIKVTGFHSVRGKSKTVNLVLFEGRCESELFSGEILPGVDTQTVMPDGSVFLSARYIISGTDRDGNHSKIFIENSVSPANGKNETSPVIVTDSPVLCEYENRPLRGTLEGTDDGIIIVISAI